MEHTYQDGDRLKIKGRVYMAAIDKDGNTMWEHVGQNLVVDAGRENVSHLIVGDTTNRSITTIKFGSGTTPTDVSQADLDSAFVTKSIGLTSYPSTTEVLINWTLDYAEGNGNTLNEMGLFCGNSKMFSRILRGPIAKNNSFKLVGTWTFSL